MLEAFKIFDGDNSGTISAHEFREVLCNVGDSKFWESDMNLILREGDLDGDGTISYPEFTRLMCMK